MQRFTQLKSIYSNYGKYACYSLLAFCMACNDTPEPTQPYDEGVIVVNSGNFFDNNGSLSLIKRDTKTADLDIFMKENARPITGGVSGYAEQDGKGLILVDNSTAGLDKVEIVNARTMKSLGTLKSPDIENPRAVIGVATNKVYIVCWGLTGSFPNFYTNTGYIAVVDLTTNTVTKKINLQRGAEAIVIVGNEAFVAGVGDDNVIQVIDTQKDELKPNSINIGSEVSELIVDANQKIWTFVGQDAIRVNPSTKAIEAKLKVGNSTQKNPANITLSSDRKTIYFTYNFYDAADGYKQKGEVYSFQITDATITTTKPFAARVFSGLGYDPKSNTIYAAATPSFKQSGYVLRYQPNGTLIDSVKVEIAPTKFFFK